MSLTAPDPDILSQRLRQVLLARQDREQVVYLQRNRDPDVYSGGNGGWMTAPAWSAGCRISTTWV
ncbi:MAG: hypothetical protein KDE08_16025 [Rhodobacteraceae bacterium]|nr:hypothetical protein [Paracoccaceae bacterium]